MHKVRIAVCLLLIFSFSSCEKNNRSKKNEAEEVIADVDFDKIKKRGYIIVSMDNSSTGYFVYKGKTMGYEYELLNRFTKKHGLELRIDVTPSLEEGFNKLNRGETDILAYNLTITKERKKRIDFTRYHSLARQVLIQRKPEGWKKMHPKKIDRLALRNPIDLIGKIVHVRHHSAYLERMRNLSEEIGGDIILVEEDPEIETEKLIRKVAEGEIDYTVAEEDIALVNASFYPNLDVKTPVSFPQQIAWGIRKNASGLKGELDKWITDIRNGPAYYAIYNRYFQKRSEYLNPDSEFFAMESGKLSPYDDMVKEVAIELGWDWRLLSAQIYKESQFNPKAVSWAGARGLMQLMPNTAQAHGAQNPHDPRQNLNAGKKHLMWLENFWKDEITDPEERIKFVLGSYNVGQGHVKDAMALAEKYGDDPKKWAVVEEYLLKKSQRKYYLDPVVKYGYCRGTETVNYVRTVYSIYQTYKEIVPETV